MSSKEELYKLLLETSPYGTLFFVYGMCVDCNPRAREILGCDKRTLLGSSLDETELSEPLALISLKQQINNALEDGVTQLDWQLQIGDTEEQVSLHLQQPHTGSKELMVTLMPSMAAPLASSEDFDAPAERVSPRDGDGESRSQAPSHAQQSASADQASSAIESTSSDHAAASITDADAEAGPAQNEAASRAQTAGEDAVSKQIVLGKLKTNDGGGHCYDGNVDRNIYFDNLTQLPNRQLVIETIRKSQLATANEPMCAALMLIDLDHFKDINDSWGHNVGDQVLFKVARAIESMDDSTVMVARMSGDEFVLFMPDAGGDLTEAALNASAIASRVKEMIAHPIFYDGNEFILTASVGIALVTDHDITPERALQYADTAMYEAKRKGRNGIAFFDQSISDKAQRQIGLNTRLRKAVDNQEFALYIQPQISIRDGLLVGGEALLRWVNTDRVINMPSEFIPLLEASGLIVDVGHWVIRTACEYIRNFIDEGLWRDHMRLGINISPRQFNDPQLFEVIEHSLRSYEIDPKFLNFEVTENLVIEDVEDVIEKMAAIKSLGSKFSIDDFGIGYSSMIYLKRLPFDWLKIDREFIRNIHSDAESRGVVEAILAVSRQYGLHVTAEGVEDLESLEVLRKAGCDTYQGAHYSMPVPVKQFREFLIAA